MGVYIRGMEMPTSCDSCMFSRRSIHNIDWCVLTEKDLPCNCPLVPVPPHGDLIDRDELRGTLSAESYAISNSGFGEPIYGMSLYGILKVASDAPTIIPAEEGE